jgi:putative hydrolase of the HAD superfamily
MSRLCVVFDLDDTLYLERDYVRSGFAAVGRWASANLAVSDLGERAWKLFEQGERIATFQAVMSKLGIEERPDLLEQMLQIYRTHDPDITLLPDSLACLAALRDKALLALITDGMPERQRSKCAKLGIIPWLDHVICTGDWREQFHKPHPRAFESMQMRFGSADCHYIYVADNPMKDFIAPLALGWNAVRVRRPDGLHFSAEPLKGQGAHFEVANLCELVDLIT